MFLLNYEVIKCIYFLFHIIAFNTIISLMHNKSIKTVNFVAFTILTSIFSLGCKYIFSISNVELIKLLNSMIILINCIITLKMDLSNSLITTLTYALINFIVNVFTLTFNVSISSNYFMLCQSFIYTLIISFFYKCLYNPQARNMLHQLKNLIIDNLDIYFLLLILIMSYDFSAKPNIQTAYTSFFYQSILIICIIQIIKNKIKYKTMNNIIRKLTLENEKSKQLIDNIRVFKHDYGNTLCSIGGYISLNDMNGLKRFYSKVTDDFSNSNNLQKINTTSINEPSIYNLFASKSKTIIKNNLKFDFYSTINYKKLYISPYELSKILGIFLDNAIEASSLSNEKELLISCETLKNKKHQIIIKNSYTNKDVDIDKIYLKGYSSKTVKSGLGLWEVSKIIRNSPNISLDTEKDENYFVQKLTISDKIA